MGFGKLGSAFSWQHDNLEKFKVTIGGELKMLMLIEELYIKDIELISVNTDGVVIHYSEEQRQTILDIWEKWEQITTYTLEDTYYKQIIFSSVNDYIAEIISPKTKETLYFKYKGDFEIDKEWHKNSSQRIVRIALKRYFIDGIDVKDTIINHLNTKDYESIKNYGIFDFCIGRKKNGNQEYELVGRNSQSLSDKVIRYFISNNGRKLFKKYKNKPVVNNTIDMFANTVTTSYKYEAVSKGFLTTLFQEYKEFDYNINYNYYIHECNKIINQII